MNFYKNSKLSALAFLTLLALSLLSCDKDKENAREEDNQSHSPTPTPRSTIQGSDPLYKYAWHLENTGQNSFALFSAIKGKDINVKKVIASGIQGAEVTIAVSDSGIEIGHEDLLGNYTFGISKNFLLPPPYNGDPLISSIGTPLAHGTAVTGIIAAEGWNGRGSRGVAPLANYGGFNFLAKGVIQSIDKELYQMTGQFDIFNYSYGKESCDYKELGANLAERISLHNAFKAGVTSLRSGKGAIYVKAAGNEFISDPKNCNPYLKGWANYYLGNSVWIEKNNLPYLIVVGAINSQGNRAFYSNPGVNIWVTAPGGDLGKLFPAIITTDISGCSFGFSNSSNTTNDFEDGHILNQSCKYTSVMNGTSAATPIVSGVIALILDENPDLGWRDIKHIISSTATIIDFNTGSSGHPKGRNLAGHTYQQGWIRNKAGYYFHNWYGFGLINAEKAVEMAKSYNVDLGTLLETINSNDTWKYDSGVINQSISNNTPLGTSHTLNVLHNYTIEAIQIRLSIDHEYVENLGIELTSPSGTKSILTNINSAVLDRNIDDRLLTTNAFYGESSTGLWKIRVIDGADINADGTTGDSGVLRNWKINILGHSL